jgi:hypothetical protein
LLSSLLDEKIFCLLGFHFGRIAWGYNAKSIMIWLQCPINPKLTHYRIFA